MKLKELPGSLYESFKLRYLTKENTIRPAERKIPVVVSLTSIESRLSTLDIVIKSLLRQSVTPKLIVLWLHESLKYKLPPRLVKLQSERFQFRFVGIASSHKKLVYSLKEFPDHKIVVCDDDFIYPENWLALLFEDAQKYPNSIIANSVREISYDLDTLLPYLNWPHITRLGSTGPNYLALGYGGVLYPKNCFHNDVYDEALFLALTPRADDLWFKLMSHLHGTETRKASKVGAPPIPIAGTQTVSLKNTNVKADHNRDQWLALCGHYGIPKL